MRASQQATRSQASYKKAVSEAHLQDTAYHFAAVYCFAGKFESILEEILKATRIQVSDWTSSEIPRMSENPTVKPSFD